MNWVEYDIYEMLPSGGRLWRASAATLEHAKERLIGLSAKGTATYAICHSSSGKPLDPARSDSGQITKYREVAAKTIGGTSTGLFANKFKRLVFSLRNGFFPPPTES